MRSLPLSLTMSLILLPCWLAPAVADDPPVAERVEALIAKLGAKQLDDREAALRQLYAIGDPARQSLLAAREHQNGEVRSRVARLLALLAHRQGALEFAVVAKPGVQIKERARKASEDKEGQGYAPPKGYRWIPIAPSAQAKLGGKELLIAPPGKHRWDLGAIGELRTIANPMTGGPVPFFRIAPKLVPAFRAFTGRHLDRQLAIIVFGQVISAPTIQAALEGEGMILGLSAAELKALQTSIKALRAGNK